MRDFELWTDIGQRRKLWSPRGALAIHLEQAARDTDEKWNAILEEHKDEIVFDS